MLRQQPGLLVELKRWVAQEAASNGQIVKDADLTDQKIFARLVSDTQFRSVATRLLERYGYLVPKINPESDAGQEQKLILQARANQLAQEQNQRLEAQLPQANRLPTQPYQQARDCQESDSQGDPNGTELRPEPRRPFARRSGPKPDDRCKSVPRLASSNPQEIRTVASSPQNKLRLVRTRRVVSNLPDHDEDDGLVPPGVLATANAQVLTASSVFPSQSDTLSDPTRAYRMNGAAPQCPSRTIRLLEPAKENVYSGHGGSSRNV